VERITDKLHKFHLCEHIDQHIKGELAAKLAPWLEEAKENKIKDVRQHNFQAYTNLKKPKQKPHHNPPFHF